MALKTTFGLIDMKRKAPGVGGVGGGRGGGMARSAPPSAGVLAAFGGGGGHDDGEGEGGAAARANVSAEAAAMSGAARAAMAAAQKAAQEDPGCVRTPMLRRIASAPCGSPCLTLRTCCAVFGMVAALWTRRRRANCSRNSLFAAPVPCSCCCCACARHGSRVRSAYDYDGWKESTEAAAMSSREKAKAELAAAEAARRAPRYIGALKAKAVEREVGVDV